jgi:drug/metabolite transporter (DMT)-like permease
MTEMPLPQPLPASGFAKASPDKSGRGATHALAAGDLGLFAGTVLIWSTTWLALKFQLGVVDPQISIVWRFAIAAPLMFLVCMIAGQRLVFPLRTHLRFAALGVFLYSTNFILFYNAGHFVVSGLLSVIFSLASLTNIALAVLFLREPLRGRVALGALLGLSGITLLFWHEVDWSNLGSGPLIGLLLGFLGCVSFSVGNVLAQSVQRDGVSVLAANAWGVSYGVGINAVVGLLAGSAFIIEPTARYVLALLWLAIPGSVLAFWMYLNLLGRIGADRAGYTTVLSPVLALLVSTFVEDFHWSAFAFAGLVLVAAGNVLVLRRGKA